MSTKPLATAALVTANLAAFGLELAGNGQAICETHGLVPAHLQPQTILTSLFLHDPGNYSHIVGNMVFLAVFGPIVEKALGATRFLALYLAAGVAGAFLHIAVDPTSIEPMVGASGAIFGLLAVGATIKPKLLPFVGAFVAWNIYLALASTGEGVSFGAHLGGFTVGVLVAGARRFKAVNEA